ncbi:MAG: AbrB family transcriptional regulator, partial [Candidatus Atribacteria bacterium]
MKGQADEPQGGCGCYKVQAMVTVDERGQMVLPKDVRDRAGIKA